MAGHAVIRAIALTLLGVFLSSLDKGRTNWLFTNVLSQIGLGYFFAFLLLGRPVRVQVGALVGILAGTWLAFVIYQTPTSYAPEKVAADPQKGEVFTGFYSHWNKNGNVASGFDMWFLKQFPATRSREGELEPFEYNRGGYATLNFVPSMGTTLLGILCGQLLMSSATPSRKFWQLTGLAVLLLVLGVTAGATICPIVKRIWTPSWVLFSGGYVVGLLALFYVLFDILPLQILARPMVIVGMNSLAMYLMGQMLGSWFLEKVVQMHLGDALQAVLSSLAQVTGYSTRLQGVSETLGESTYLVFQPMVDSTCAFLVMWSVVYYLCRQKIFFRM
jgi:predicted acyltransferase